MLMNAEVIRVLVVDDDEVIARIIQLHLQAKGFKVDTAHDGDKGLALYEQGRHDLIVLDHKLPGMSGLEIVRYLKKKEILPPIIMISGLGRDDIAVDALKLGVVDYVVKDPDNRFLERLQSAVGDAVHRHRREMAVRKTVPDVEALSGEINERVKELTCLYGIERVLGEDGLPFEQLCQRVVDLIPAAFQEPEPLGVRLTVGHGRYSTAAFCETPDMLAVPIEGPKRVWGRIEVSGPTAGPAKGPRIFLKEEELLLKAVAARMGRFFDQRSGEDLLRVAHNELRKMSHAIDQNACAVVITDKDGRIEYVNPAFSRMTGYSSGDVLGKNPRILKSGESPSEEYAQLWKTITAGHDWRGEFHNRRKDGTLYWDHSSISPVTDAQGRITHFVCIKEDITESRRAQEALRQSEKRFKDVAVSTLDWIWEIDGESRYIYASQRVRDILGYDPEELVGRKPFDFMPAEEGAKIGETYRQLASRNAPVVDLVSWFVHKGGRLVCVRSNAVPVLDEKERVTGYRGVDEDITAQQTAETRVRSLKQQIEFILGATKTGLDIIDEDYNIIYIDPEWAKVYGDSSGRKCHEYFMGLDAVCPDCALVEAFRTRRTVVKEEQLMREGGRWVQVTSIPFQNDEGKWFVAEVNVDITERKRVEEELRHSEEKFKAQYRGVPIPTFTCQKKDDDFVLVDYNDAAATVTRGGVAAHVGKSARSLYPDVSEIMADMAECYAEKTKTKREAFFLMRSINEWKHLFITCVYVPPDIVMVHTEDVTRQKESEKLRDAVLNLSAAIAGCHTEDEVCRVVVEGVRSQMGVDRCGLFMGHPNKPPFRGTYGTDMNGQTTDEHHFLWDIGKERDVADLFSSRPYKSGFPLGAPEAQPGEEALSSTFIALRHAGEVFGIISVDNRISRRPVTEAQMLHIALLAEVVGNALQVARARAALESSMKETHRINRELEQFNQAMVGRESRIIDLKEEVNQLLKEQGRPSKYPAVWQQAEEKPGDAPGKK